MAISFPIAKPLATPSRAGIGGPKSAAGKARSAANAVKHGLASANPVILEYETVEKWESFRNAFAADLHPQGPVEEELARELALIQWRRRRIPAYEARCADRRLQTAIASLEYYAERESQAELEERARVTLNEALLPNTEDLQRLLRYEAHLDRKFTQTLRHLHRLQKARHELEAAPCKTNSTPQPQVPATSAPAVALVPSVPSVASVPSRLAEPLPNPPNTEHCKTNSPTPPPTTQPGRLLPQPAQAGFASQEGATSVGPSLAASATPQPPQPAPHSHAANSTLSSIGLVHHTAPCPPRLPPGCPLR